MTAGASGICFRLCALDQAAACVAPCCATLLQRPAQPAAAEQGAGAPCCATLLQPLARESGTDLRSLGPRRRGLRVQGRAVCCSLDARLADEAGCRMQTYWSLIASPPRIKAPAPAGYCAAGFFTRVRSPASLHPPPPATTAVSPSAASCHGPALGLLNPPRPHPSPAALYSAAAGIMFSSTHNGIMFSSTHHGIIFSGIIFPSTSPPPATLFYASNTAFSSPAPPSNRKQRPSPAPLARRRRRHPPCRAARRREAARCASKAPELRIRVCVSDRDSDYETRIIRVSNSKRGLSQRRPKLTLDRSRVGDLGRGGQGTPRLTRSPASENLVVQKQGRAVRPVCSTVGRP